MLASDQIWSVVFGGHHGLVLLALKPMETHHFSSLTSLGLEILTLLYLLLRPLREIMSDLWSAL